MKRESNGADAIVVERSALDGAWSVSKGCSPRPFAEIRVVMAPLPASTPVRATPADPRSGARGGG